MFKRLLFFSFLILSFSGVSHAQQTEGFIQFSIKVTPLDTTLATRQKAGMVMDSKMMIYFCPEFSRIDFVMGKMMESKTIVDNINKKGITLNKNPYAKMGKYLTEQDILGDPGVDASAEVKLMNETKTILGYTCKKAIVLVNGVETIYWYTTEIKLDHSIAQKMINRNIPGFPLAFSSISDGILMEFQASNFEKEIKDKTTVFSMDVPQGYVMM